MTTRGSITDKWHRVCLGCGERYHINEIKEMNGNECCPGMKFSRDRSMVIP